MSFTNKLTALISTNTVDIQNHLYALSENTIEVQSNTDPIVEALMASPNPLEWVSAFKTWLSDINSWNQEKALLRLQIDDLLRKSLRDFNSKAVEGFPENLTFAEQENLASAWAKAAPIRNRATEFAKAAFITAIKRPSELEELSRRAFLIAGQKALFPIVKVASMSEIRYDWIVNVAKAGNFNKEVLTENLQNLFSKTTSMFYYENEKDIFEIMRGSLSAGADPRLRLNGVTTLKALNDSDFAHKYGNDFVVKCAQLLFDNGSLPEDILFGDPVSEAKPSLKAFLETQMEYRDFLDLTNTVIPTQRVQKKI